MFLLHFLECLILHKDKFYIEIVYFSILKSFFILSFCLPNTCKIWLIFTTFPVTTLLQAMISLGSIFTVTSWLSTYSELCMSCLCSLSRAITVHFPSCPLCSSLTGFLLTLTSVLGPSHLPADMVFLQIHVVCLLASFRHRILREAFLVFTLWNTIFPLLPHCLSFLPALFFFIALNSIWYIYICLFFVSPFLSHPIFL